MTQFERQARANQAYIESMREKVEELFHKAMNEIPNGSGDCTDCVDTFYEGLDEIFGTKSED